MARVLVAAAAIPAAPLSAAAPAPTAGANLVELSALPLRTHGRHVVDRYRRRVQFACVNWYGAQQEQMVMNGLDVQPLSVIAATIVRLRFNCVRLPFSLELVFGNRTAVPHANLTLRANPKLQALSPMELFDATVAGLTSAGLLVVLNQHISAAGWCCSNSDGEGLWYTDQYPEEAWLRGLGRVAARYRHDPRVVGFDLRNEVRPWMSLIPTWGDGNPATDWAMAAVKGAKRVLAENEQALIVISGIHFGMRLSEVALHPIHVTEPALRERTVYTTHFYYGWCFDLMARDMLHRNQRALLFFACWLWALLAVDSFVARQRLLPEDCIGLPLGEEWPPPVKQHEPLHWQSSESPRFYEGGQRALPQELVLALYLKGLLCALFAYGEYLGQTCGHLHIVSPPAFVVMSSICLKLIYLVWARVLLAYTCVLALWPQADVEEEHACDHLGLDCLEVPRPEAALWATVPESQHVPSKRACRLQRISPSRSCSTSKAATLCGDAGEAKEVELTGSRDAALLLNTKRKVSLDDVSELRSAGACGRLASRCCGRRACLRLARPLRARKGGTALASLALLGALAAVRAACTAYSAFAGELDACWGPVLGGPAALEAPVWLSEFGTDDNGLYWAYLLRYMRERSVDFAYWSINGEKRYHQSETYGLLEDDSATVRHEWKLHSLQRLIIGAPQRQDAR